MPDISKCANTKCKKRKTCYRFTVKPDPLWQSYGSFEPDSKGKCEYYWKAPKRAKK